MYCLRMSATAVLVVVSLFNPRTPVVKANQPNPSSVSLKVDMTVVAEGETYYGLVYIIDGIAMVLEPTGNSQVLVVFDLDSKSWREPESARTVTLEDAKKWAEGSRKKTLTSLESESDEKARRFVESLLVPKFSVRERDGKLFLTSETVNFVVTPDKEVPKCWYDRLAAYDELNAYHKAMTTHPLLPFTQLVVSKELSQRRIWPRLIEMEVSTLKGKVKLQARMESSELSESERNHALMKLADFDRQ